MTRLTDKQKIRAFLRYVREILCCCKRCQDQVIRQIYKDAEKPAKGRKA